MVMEKGGRGGGGRRGRCSCCGGRCSGDRRQGRMGCTRRVGCLSLHLAEDGLCAGLSHREGNSATLDTSNHASAQRAQIDRVQRFGLNRGCVLEARECWGPWMACALARDRCACAERRGALFNESMLSAIGMPAERGDSPIEHIEEMKHAKTNQWTTSMQRIKRQEQTQWSCGAHRHPRRSIQQSGEHRRGERERREADKAR